MTTGGSGLAEKCWRESKFTKNVRKFLQVQFYKQMGELSWRYSKVHIKKPSIQASSLSRKIHQFSSAICSAENETAKC
jgi:hypothetical protein